MKIITASNSRSILRISKNEWLIIGKRSGWIKQAEFKGDISFQNPQGKALFFFLNNVIKSGNGFFKDENQVKRYNELLSQYKSIEKSVNYAQGLYSFEIYATYSPPLPEGETPAARKRYALGWVFLVDNLGVQNYGKIKPANAYTLQPESIVIKFERSSRKEEFKKEESKEQKMCSGCGKVPVLPDKPFCEKCLREELSGIKASRLRKGKPISS
jgi:hypothetical protein